MNNLSKEDIEKADPLEDIISPELREQLLLYGQNKILAAALSKISSLSKALNIPIDFIEKPNILKDKKVFVVVKADSLKNQIPNIVSFERFSSWSKAARWMMKNKFKGSCKIISIK